MCNMKIKRVYIHFRKLFLKPFFKADSINTPPSTRTLLRDKTNAGPVKPLKPVTLRLFLGIEIDRQIIFHAEIRRLAYSSSAYRPIKLHDDIATTFKEPLIIIDRASYFQSSETAHRRVHSNVSRLKDPCRRLFTWVSRYIVVNGAPPLPSSPNQRKIMLKCKLQRGCWPSGERASKKARNYRYQLRSLVVAKRERSISVKA